MPADRIGRRYSVTENTDRGDLDDGGGPPLRTAAAHDRAERRDVLRQGSFGGLADPIASSRDASVAGEASRPRPPAAAVRRRSGTPPGEAPDGDMAGTYPMLAPRRRATTRRTRPIDPEQAEQDLRQLELDPRFRPPSVTYSPHSPTEGWTRRWSTAPETLQVPAPSLGRRSPASSLYGGSDFSDDRSADAPTIPGTPASARHSASELLPAPRTHEASAFEPGFPLQMRWKTIGAAPVWVVRFVVDLGVKLVSAQLSRSGDTEAQAAVTSLLSSVFEVGAETAMHAAVTGGLLYTKRGKALSERFHNEDETRDEAFGRIALTSGALALLGSSLPMQYAKDFALMGLMRKAFDSQTVSQTLIDGAISSILSSGVLGVGAVALYATNARFKKRVDAFGKMLAEALQDAKKTIEAREEASRSLPPQLEHADDMELGAMRAQEPTT